MICWFCRRSSEEVQMQAQEPNKDSPAYGYGYCAECCRVSTEGLKEVLETLAGDGSKV